jgi:hypothetical protein
MTYVQRAGIVLTAVLFAACGGDQTQGTSASGDGATEITVVGEDAPAFEPGDSDNPDEEVDVASVVTVTVDIPADAELFGVAVVALEDVSLADAPSVEIARVEMPVDQLAGQGNKVDVFLPLPLDGTIDVTATVHIDVDENGAFSQGDWISPELAMVTPETQSNIVLGLVRI